MDLKIDNQEQRGTVRPKKLYTQQEVNDLLKKQKTNTIEGQIESNTKNIASLVRQSNRILVSISTHAFPFDIFPDIINIEEGRITIIRRQLLSSEVHSIDIRNISNIFINTSLFFSQLVIISKTYEENEVKISSLRTKEAIFARRIIEGLRIFENQKIDTSSYSKEELVSKLKELSTTKIVR